MPKLTTTKLSSEIESFVRTYVDDLADGNASVFLGAGMSAAAGYVNWKGLLKDIADDLGLDIDRETNLVALAQYHVNERQTRAALAKKILDEFVDLRSATPSHEILSRLPISSYWTTNYDRILETALEKEGRRPDVKYAVGQFGRKRKNRRSVVYKMHGDVEHSDNAILTKDDYEGYFREHELFVTELSGELVSKTFLFLGFSFSDPNIDYILSRVRVTLRKQPKTHYCILREEPRAPKEKQDRFQYRRRQQDYLVKDLQRLGIRTLLVKEYADVQRVLELIEQRYRQRTVFFSGSISEYPAGWSPTDAHRLVASATAHVIEEGMTVVTGFGLGVGTSVVSGAVEAIAGNSKLSHQQLVARPFPVTANSAKQKLMARRYREDIMSAAGVAAYFFGNKNVNGKVVDAEGVQEEFDIAQELGLRQIPVGATGGMARRLWERVNAEIDTYHPNASKEFRRNFKILGDGNAKPKAILDAFTAIVFEVCE